MLAVGIALGVGLSGVMHALIFRAPDDPGLTAPGDSRSARHALPRNGPARWFEALKRTWLESSQDQIPAVAAGATFYALLALFPALGAFVSLYGIFANIDEARRQVLGLGGLLPGGAMSVIGDQLTRLGRLDHTNLGFAFISGLLVSLWSSNAGMKALILGLNVAYEERERRGFLRLNAVSLAFTLGAIIFAIAASVILVAAPRTLQWLGLTGLMGLSLLRWPVLLLTVTGLLSVLYRYGPSREAARWRWLTPGSVLAALVWMVMSLLFSFYVSNFGHYDKTYGSLGAMIGFMTWIWLSLTVVLLGAELNAEIEREANIP